MHSTADIVEFVFPLAHGSSTRTTNVWTELPRDTHTDTVQLDVVTLPSDVLAAIVPGRGCDGRQGKSSWGSSTMVVSDCGTNNDASFASY